jgi:hypothetical protein
MDAAHSRLLLRTDTALYTLPVGNTPLTTCICYLPARYHAAPSHNAAAPLPTDTPTTSEPPTPCCFTCTCRADLVVACNLQRCLEHWPARRLQHGTACSWSWSKGWRYRAQGTPVLQRVARLLKPCWLSRSTPSLPRTRHFCSGFAFICKPQATWPCLVRQWQFLLACVPCVKCMQSSPTRRFASHPTAAHCLIVLLSTTCHY